MRHLELSRDICTHTQLLVLVVVLGIYAVWGFGPSRGSPFSAHRAPPHPPPWPSFKVLWRGMGGQGRPSTPGGVRVSRPLPTSQKDGCNDDGGRGLMDHAPQVSIRITCAMHANNNKGERQSLEGVADKRGQGAKAKRFLGCGCRQGMPTSNTDVDHHICKPQDRLRCCFAPPSVQNLRSSFSWGNFNGFPPHAHGLSGNVSRLQSFSVTFNNNQSLSAHFHSL